MKKTKKLWIALLTLFYLVVSLSPAYANVGYDNFTIRQNSTRFLDVAQKDWFYETVQTAYQLNLMKGISSDAFSPKGQVTVAEAVTLAVRLYEIYYNERVTSDRNTSPWYKKYVDSAIQTGILNPDYFKNYDAPISRRDFAALYADLFPFEKNEVINKVSILDIRDVDDGTYLKDYMLKMYGYGIMTGDSTFAFKPDSYISRAEVAAIVSRMARPKLRKNITATNTITREKHIERSYNWFYNQLETGVYSEENCGPCVTAMTLQWVNPDLNVTPEKLRSWISPSGGWWYTDDIVKVLNNYGIPNSTKPFKDANQVMAEIDNERIVILCLDGYYFNSSYTEKGSGHFIIVKGYTVQNGIVRFETYNPDNGKDTYYFAKNLLTAAKEWWPHYIAVGK